MKKQFINSEIKRITAAVLDANWQIENKINLAIDADSVHIYQIVDGVHTYAKTAYYCDTLNNFENKEAGVVPFTNLLTDFKSNFAV